MRYLLNGQDITNQPFTHNGIKYPANWWNNTSPDKIAALGIEAVQEHPENILYNLHRSSSLGGIKMLLLGELKCCF